MHYFPTFSHTGTGCCGFWVVGAFVIFVWLVFVVVHLFVLLLFWVWFVVVVGGGGAGMLLFFTPDPK